MLSFKGITVIGKSWRPAAAVRRRGRWVCVCVFAQIRRPTSSRKFPLRRPTSPSCRKRKIPKARPGPNARLGPAASTATHVATRCAAAATQQCTYRLSVALPCSAAGLPQLGYLRRCVSASRCGLQRQCLNRKPTVTMPTVAEQSTTERGRCSSSAQRVSVCCVESCGSAK